MKIALIGYGKMGKEIEKIAIARGHEIVSIIDINNQEEFLTPKLSNRRMWLLSSLILQWHTIII
mgnify:CR=1 FL=1